MSIVFHILEEEIQRLQRLSQKYKHEIQKLPKGSISLKKRYNKQFAYLSFRENDKVKFNYLGSSDNPAILLLKEKINQRKQYENKLKIVLNDIKEVSTAINARTSKAIH